MFLQSNCSFKPWRLMIFTSYSYSLFIISIYSEQKQLHVHVRIYDFVWASEKIESRSQVKHHVTRSYNNIFQSQPDTTYEFELFSRITVSSIRQWYRRSNQSRSQRFRDPYGQKVWHSSGKVVFTASSTGGTQYSRWEYQAKNCHEKCREENNSSTDGWWS